MLRMKAMVPFRHDRMVLRRGQEFSAADLRAKELEQRGMALPLTEPHAPSPAASTDGNVAVVVPADWRELHHSTKRKLAREISSEDPVDTAAAEAVIAAYVATLS